MMNQPAENLDETTVVDPQNPEGIPEGTVDSDAEVWAELANDDDDLGESEPAAEAEVSEAEPKADLEVAASEPESTPVEPTEPVAETDPQPTPPVTPDPEPDPASLQPQPEPVLTPEQQEFQRQQQAWLQQQQLQQQQTQHTAQRQQAIDQLAQNYTLDQTQVEAFAVNPEEVLPKLAAELHMTVIEQVLPLVARMIPQQVQNIQQRVSSTQADEDTFFAAYPELKTHEAQVLQFAGIWRQMNPTASVEEATKAIGEHMQIALGLHSAQQTPTPPAEPTAPTPTPPAGSAPRIGIQKPPPKSDMENFIEEVLADEE
jgi:hypothetical protein